jgi:hypothetical protein
MLSSFSDYDPENRFMKCAMDYKMQKHGFNPENRFDQCAYEKKQQSQHISHNKSVENKPFENNSVENNSVENKIDIIPNYDNITNRDTRSNSCCSNNSKQSVNKYPNSRLRSKTNSIQDVRLMDSSPKKDSFDDNFPSLSPNLNSIQPKTPIMIPLSSPKNNKTPTKKPIVDSITSLSLQGGKIITKEIITIIEEPPPLVITPSKWSDLLRTSSK